MLVRVNHANDELYIQLRLVGFDLANDNDEYPSKDAEDLGTKEYLAEDVSSGVRRWSAYGGLTGFEVDLRQLDSKIKVLRFWSQ